MIYLLCARFKDDNHSTVICAYVLYSDAQKEAERRNVIYEIPVFWIMAVALVSG